jgi:hypothetical protein
MADIVRDVVRPPLLWTVMEFEVGDGRVVVAEVSPSNLGPYMVQGYGDNRYYRRGPTGVVEMTEFEVSSAYALAGRSAEHREEQWRRHFLPIATPPDQPWLSIAALPFEPLTPIFEGKGLDSGQFLHPPALVNVLWSLPIQQASVHHWADGITADDSAGGAPYTFILRLHRDGAIGIVQKWLDIIDLNATARAVNAYLTYIAHIWGEYSLRSPVELEVGIAGVSYARALGTSLSMGSHGVVQPPGVTVPKVSIMRELLPLELQRAQVRHGIAREFIERLSYAFDSPHSGELFSIGRLFTANGAPSRLVLAPGLLAESRPNGSNLVAHIDEAGRVRGASGDVKCFVVGGALIDVAGDTLAVVEMNDGVACPPDFIANYTDDKMPSTLVSGNERTPDQGGPDVPSPTGKWSNKLFEEAVA